MARRITILGSTGSIGRQALDVVRHYPDLFDVVGLAANANAALLADQIAEFNPKFACLADEAAGKDLPAQQGTSVLLGAKGLEDIAAQSVDTILCGMVGAAGLRPIVAAIEAGNRIALANKEPLVIAGRLIMGKAQDHGVEVLPVDSEHNAIFQCLHGNKLSDVQCIHLTASGGPFYGKPRESLADVLPEQAAKHPNWDMGVKISVDSATLMNKGLEVIEAMWLFGLPLEKVQVVIHPQSIIHSLVEFTDGTILAHMGLTDMKFPIQFALTWPERVQSPMGRLDLTTMRALTFAAPDFSEFPCLKYALDAARTGGTIPAVLNAANETAVAAFCQKRIGFLQISDVVSETVNAVTRGDDGTLDQVIAADSQGRRVAETIIDGLKVAH
jgi:1-deoxy-D-xylulose-5-phosphate reductoisomerase